MKLIELKPQNQIDLMSTMMIGQSMYASVDPNLSDVDRLIIGKKAHLIGTIFCGVAVSLNENGYKISPTLMSINEPDTRDGVYCYAIKSDPKTEGIIPKMDMRIEDGFCIYGTVDLHDPRIEIYYGSALICVVNMITDEVQVIPKVSETRTEDSTISDADFKIVIDSINENIMKLNIAFAAGFKAGMEAASGEE